MNVHDSDLKIEFLHPHGPGKTFSWPTVADECFVPALNILCVITGPAAITGQMYQISGTTLNKLRKQMNTIKYSRVYIKV